MRGKGRTMGLSIFVGLPSEVSQRDPDALPVYLGGLVSVNAALRAAGLPEHREPTIDADDMPLEIDMYGYSTIHHLRWVAVHVLHNKPTRTAQAEDPSGDALVSDYYENDRFAAELSPAQRSPDHAVPWGFRHLLLHSDAEGYYLPQPVDAPLIPDERLNVPGGMIGSSLRLRDECAALARHMALPLATDPEIAADLMAEGAGDSGWQRLPSAAYACLQLHRAAEASVRYGAAIVFG